MQAKEKIRNVRTENNTTIAKTDVAIYEFKCRCGSVASNAFSGKIAQIDTNYGPIEVKLNNTNCVCVCAHIAVLFQYPIAAHLQQQHSATSPSVLCSANADTLYNVQLTYEKSTTRTYIWNIVLYGLRQLIR